MKRGARTVGSEHLSSPVEPIGDEGQSAGWGMMVRRVSFRSVRFSVVLSAEWMRA